VTVPVQSMVKNSQLIVPAGTQLVRKFNLRYIITVCEINTTTTGTSVLQSLHMLQPTYLVEAVR